MKFQSITTYFMPKLFTRTLLAALLLSCSLSYAQASKVVILSLDGATPRLIRAYQLLRLLPPHEGFGRL